MRFAPAFLDSKRYLCCGAGAVTQCDSGSKDEIQHRSFLKCHKLQQFLTYISFTMATISIFKKIRRKNSPTFMLNSVCLKG
jgi:hypothetical protein